MWRHDLRKFQYGPIASHLYIYVFYLRQITVLVFVHVCYYNIGNKESEWQPQPTELATAHKRGHARFRFDFFSYLSSSAALSRDQNFYFAFFSWQRLQSPTGASHVITCLPIPPSPPHPFPPSLSALSPLLNSTPTFFLPFTSKKNKVGKQYLSS